MKDIFPGQRIEVSSHFHLGLEVIMLLSFRSYCFSRKNWSLHSWDSLNLWHDVLSLVLTGSQLLTCLCFTFFLLFFWDSSDMYVRIFLQDPLHLLICFLYLFSILYSLHVLLWKISSNLWDGWMASPTLWTWVWASSRSWWCTGKPGVLQFMVSQSVRHDLVTELNWKPF